VGERLRGTSPPVAAHQPSESPGTRVDGKGKLVQILGRRRAAEDYSHLAPQQLRQTPGRLLASQRHLFGPGHEGENMSPSVAAVTISASRFHTSSFRPSR
jgi:hypothetical protein